MKFTSNVKSFFLYLVFFVLILVLFELFTRTFIFYYSKDINIYKIGIDKKYVLDIEDLTEKKFNVINLSKNDTEIQENKKKTCSEVVRNSLTVNENGEVRFKTESEKGKKPTLFQNMDDFNGFVKELTSLSEKIKSKAEKITGS